jgi:pyrophosphatase PpaX
MKGILWDLDDTLLDTLPGRMKSLAYAYERCMGSRTDPHALWRSTRGGTLEDLGRRLLGEDYTRFATTYREHYYAERREIRAYEGIHAVLEDCAEAGLSLAVVTSKVSWGAVEELSQANILQYFAAVVGFDDTECHKPDPEPVYAALERLVIDDPADVLFVGDSPADVFAARNAGCRSIAALWGCLDHELLRDAAPDLIAAVPDEVVEHLIAVRGVTP